MGHTVGKFKDGFRGWRIGKRKTNDVDGYEIHHSDDGECVTDHVYTLEDAKLIATAPELKLALTQVISAITGPTPAEDGSYTQRFGPAFVDYLQGIINQTN